MQSNFAKFMQILQYSSIIKRSLCLSKMNTNNLSTVKIIMAANQERRIERELKHTITILLNTRLLYLVYSNIIITFILQKHFYFYPLIRANDYGYCFPQKSCLKYSLNLINRMRQTTIIYIKFIEIHICNSPDMKYQNNK